MKQRINFSVVIVLIVYGIIYSLISIVNHYNFRTYGYDLGLFNNALYDYSHFQWNEVTLSFPHHHFKNTLGDHFSVITIFFSPLYYLFGSYSLLLVQIASVLFGSIGIRRLILYYTQNEKLALWSLIHFLSLWGIFSALAFDYHDNVVASMLIPWFVLYFERQKVLKTALFFVLILLSKENIALWMVFISIGLLINQKERFKQVFALLLALVSAFYFIVVIKYLIPFINGSEQGYNHFAFNALGGNMAEAIKTVVTRPQYVFTLLFENHLPNTEGFGIKSELHYIVLLSGGFALLLKPRYLIMLLPIFAQKLFNNDFGKWGLNYHYSIELVPIITIALFVWLSSIHSKRVLIFARILVVVTIITTLSVLDSRVSKWYNPVNSRFYKKEHYITDYNPHKVRAELKKIPSNAVVSAQSMIIPHIAFRDTIYHFPYVGDAEYIVLFPAAKARYPLTEEEMNKKTSELLNDPNWSNISTLDGLLLFKRSAKP